MPPVILRIILPSLRLSAFLAAKLRTGEAHSFVVYLLPVSLACPFAVLFSAFLLIAYLADPGFRFSTRCSLRVGFRRILSHRSFVFLLPLPVFHSAFRTEPGCPPHTLS